MQKISNVTELQNAIQLLEEKQLNDGVILRELFFKTCESLKPINIIKDTVREMVDSADLKTDVSKLVIGTASGFIAKKVLVGETHNPFSKLFGVVVEMMVSKNVIKNVDGIKSFGSALLQKIIHKQSNPKEEE